MPAPESAVHASGMSAPPSLADLAVLIPVWEPTSTLPALVEALGQQGFGGIVIVDDGSGSACEAIFAQTSTLPRVELLRHAANLGKGRALKTGFARLLHTQRQLVGVVTADADGQHTPEDIERVGWALLANPLGPVLGSRRFEAQTSGIPWRSRWGNVFARQSFRLFTGVCVSDTQTGLRGLPLALLPSVLGVPGERYEYEMAMLAGLCRGGHTPLEVPIATIYLEKNRGSHFHFFKDSLRVYLMLLRLAWARRRR